MQQYLKRVRKIDEMSVVRGEDDGFSRLTVSEM